MLIRQYNTALQIVIHTQIKNKYALYVGNTVIVG